MVDVFYLLRKNVYLSMNYAYAYKYNKLFFS